MQIFLQINATISTSKGWEARHTNTVHSIQTGLLTVQVEPSQNYSYTNLHNLDEVGGEHSFSIVDRAAPPEADVSQGV